MAVWRDARESAEPRCPGCGARRTQPDGPCAACGTVAAARREKSHVRTSDLEPYTALLYIGRLFKVLSVLIVVALLGELIMGVILEGSASLVTVLGEAVRLIALAGLLWGGGETVRLLIGAGHDLRMSRILLGRIVTRFPRPFSTPAGQRDGRRAS